MTKWRHDATVALNGTTKGVKEFQLLCSLRLGNGFVMFAPLCNVYKNPNLCVFTGLRISNFVHLFIINRASTLLESILNSLGPSPTRRTNI